MKAYTPLSLTLLAAVVLTAPSYAHKGHDHGHTHEHHHEHSNTKVDKQALEQEEKAAKGIFADTDVKKRELSDWYGDWQSIYPYLQEGSLDEVMQHKAKTKKDKTAEEYKQYYTKGYATDINRIVIDGDRFTFYQKGTHYSGQYKNEGFKILTYASGKKGVRYLFTLTKGDAKAPKFIQFSDHTIGPKKVDHYHLYLGNDGHEKLSEELSNWPTYFPAKWSKQDIIHDLTHH